MRSAFLSLSLSGATLVLAGALLAQNPAGPFPRPEVIVTFERGDVLLTPDGLRIYSDDEVWDVPISRQTDGRHGIVDQLYEAVVNGRQPSADGRWGKATLEVLLAVLASARQRQEVFLTHQVPLPN
jgi:phthalate 4,5-cis-dihydrodiol dehydrogenase